MNYVYINTEISYLLKILHQENCNISLNNFVQIFHYSPNFLLESYTVWNC